MKTPPFVVLCALILPALFFGCEQIKPERPRATTSDTLLTPPLSTLVIPVYYHVDSLESTINNKVKGTFIRKWISMNEKGDSLYLEVSRTGRIEIQWKDQTLQYSFPVHIAGKFIKQIAGIKLKNAEPIETELILHMTTKVDIAPDWNLQLTSTLKRIEWIKEPVLKVAIIKVNLTRKIEEAVNLHKMELIAKMDEALRGLLETRGTISKIWNDIQKPIRINKKGSMVWLKAHAHNLSAKLSQVENFIALEVELEASVRTILEGEEIPPSNTRLPDYKPKTSRNDSLKIFILTTIPFSKVNEVLNKELHNRKIEAQGYSATLKDLMVYGTDSGLAIQMHLRGDVDGKIYLRGRPWYDTAMSMFVVKDFGFDIDSQNALVNSADWLLHEDMLQFVDEKFRIETQPLIDQLPLLIKNAIEKGKAGEKINVTINHLALTPQQLIITKDNIQVILKATGQASIDLQKKVFAQKKRKVRRL